MYVLDFLRIAKDWKLKFPLYHRGHLSLFPGTTVYLTPVVSEEDPSPSDDSLPVFTRSFPELFGTTVQSNAWSCVYRISVALYDAPGVLHSSLESISRHGGNILQLDSTSTERELHHNVEIIVDFASLTNSSQPIRDLSIEIEGLILADCAQHIVSEVPGEFRLRVRSVSGLRRMHNMLTKARSLNEHPLVNIHHIEDKGDLQLNDNIKNMLQENGIELPFRYLITSDTKDRIFRIAFLPMKEVAIWCSIRHVDKQGALSSITDEIRKQNVTVLCALNRVQEHLGYNWFEAVLSSQKWRSNKSDTNLVDPKEEIKAILSSKNLEDYKLTWFFTPDDAKKAMLERINLPGNNQPFMPKRLNVNMWLKEKEEELGKLGIESRKKDIRSRTTNQNSLRKADQRLALLSGIEKVRRETGLLRNQVFLSLEFTDINKERIPVIADCCREVDLAFDVVETPKNEKAISAEVISRIRNSTHFIAIWTPSAKGPDGKRPSPWCLWELGVANALGKPFYVLVQNGTELLDYNIIHHSNFYYPFGSPGEFKTKVNEIINSIIS